MAEVARNLMLLLMSEKCYDNYFEEFNFFDGKYSLIMSRAIRFLTRMYEFSANCFKALLSKGLGIGIIAGSVLGSKNTSR